MIENVLYNSFLDSGRSDWLITTKVLQFHKILDDCRILGDTSFVRAPTTQHELFFWICGTLQVFFQKLQNFISVRNVWKRYWHWKCSVHRYNFREYASNFSSFWQNFRVASGCWELNHIKSLEDPILKTLAIFDESFGIFEVVTATRNSVMAVKLFCFWSVIWMRQTLN